MAFYIQNTPLENGFVNDSQIKKIIVNNQTVWELPERSPPKIKCEIFHNGIETDCYVSLIDNEKHNITKVRLDLNYSVTGLGSKDYTNYIASKEKVFFQGLPCYFQHENSSIYNGDDFKVKNVLYYKLFITDYGVTYEYMFPNIVYKDSYPYIKAILYENLIWEKHLVFTYQAVMNFTIYGFGDVDYSGKIRSEESTGRFDTKEAVHNIFSNIVTSGPDWTFDEVDTAYLLLKDGYGNLFHYDNIIN